MAAGWVEKWGEVDPEGWLARELHLQGKLDLKSTGDAITLRDDRERLDHSVSVYELRDQSNRKFAAAMAELSNGVWVVAYREGDV